MGKMWEEVENVAAYDTENMLMKIIEWNHFNQELRQAFQDFGGKKWILASF